MEHASSVLRGAISASKCAGMAGTLTQKAVADAANFAAVDFSGHDSRNGSREMGFDTRGICSRASSTCGKRNAHERDGESNERNEGNDWTVIGGDKPSTSFKSDAERRESRETLCDSNSEKGASMSTPYKDCSWKEQASREASILGANRVPPT